MRHESDLRAVAATAVATDLYCAPLLRSNERPAHNCAANGTPAAKSLINLSCQRGLQLEGQPVGPDLWIRDVAHHKPARGLVPHLTGDEANYRISISDTSPRP